MSNIHFLLYALGILKWPILVFLLSGFIGLMGWYITWPWIDLPMHFVGGASIAIAGSSFLALLQKRGFLPVLPRFLWMFFIVSFIALAAVCWEFGEFAASRMFESFGEATLQDTIVDMFLGLLGGFIASAILFKRKASVT